MTLEERFRRPPREVPRLPARRMAEFHERFWRVNRPVVLTGLDGPGAPSMFQWSLDHFERTCGEREFPVVWADRPYLSYERNTVTMTFSAFRAKVFGGRGEDGRYYYFKNPTKVLPDLGDDSDDDPFFARYGGRSVLRNVWISGPGMTIGLHFDAAENLNAQIAGRKQFLLYPPGTADYYPSAMFSQSSHVSRVARAGPDRRASDFPRLSNVVPHRALLEAGEVLYLPAFWWHEVTSSGDVNINYNFWSFPPLRKQLREPNQALRGHLGLAIRMLKYGSLQKAKRLRRAA